MAGGGGAAGGGASAVGEPVGEEAEAGRGAGAGGGAGGTSGTTTPDNLKDVQLELLHDGHESARRKAGCDAIIQKQNTLWHKHYLEEKRKDDAYDRAHKGKGKSGDRRDVP